MCLIACGKKSEKASILPDDWKMLNEKEYSIQYPDSFELDKSGQFRTNLLLFSRCTSQNDLFRENINLVIQDLPGKHINLDKLVETSEDQLNKAVPDGALIESSRQETDGLEYQKIIYKGKQGQFNLKWQQFGFVKNEKAYILTLTCEENQYDKYVKVGNKIMHTFKLK